MSEKYMEFSEVIATAKSGDVFEGKSGRIIRKECEAFFVGEDTPQHVFLSRGFVTDLWKKRPKYVQFWEAMKALSEGKTVECVYEVSGKEEIKRIYPSESDNSKIVSISHGTFSTGGGGAGILIAWINAGKWRIVE